MGSHRSAYNKTTDALTVGFNNRCSPCSRGRCINTCNNSTANGTLQPYNTGDGIDGFEILQMVQPILENKWWWTVKLGSINN